MLDSCDYTESLKVNINDTPNMKVPIDRIIKRFDEYLTRDDIMGGKAFLENWEKEAKSLKDYNGLLSIENELVGVYRKIKDSVNGNIACDKCIELLGLLNLGGTISEGTILLNVATCYKSFGKTQQALTNYQKALDIFNLKLDKNDTLFAGLYNNYALALVDNKEYSKGEEFYKLALSITLQYEKSSPDSAITYLNMADLYEILGDDTLVEESLKKGYDLLMSVKEQDSYYAYVLQKCYPTFYHFGKVKIAQDIKKLSESIYARY